MNQNLIISQTGGRPQIGFRFPLNRGTGIFSFIPELIDHLLAYIQGVDFEFLGIRECDA